MQGGGKGSMIQPQQGGYAQPMPMSGTPLTQDQMTAAQNNMQSQYLGGLSGQRLQDYNADQQQQQIGINMPQQPRPMDMGMGMGQRSANDMPGTDYSHTMESMPQIQMQGNQIPRDFYAGSGGPNFGSMPQQQPMQGMGQIPQNYAVNGSSVVRSSFNGDPNGGSINGGPSLGSMPQQSMQGGGKAAGGMGQGMGQISNNQQQLPQYQPQYQTGPMDQFVMNQRTDPFGGQTPNQDQLQNYNRFQSSQQARFGQPNRYSNTTQQPWDNANINPQPMQGGGKGMQSQQPMQGGGKSAGGKGAGMQQGGQMQGGGKGQAVGGYPTAATNFGQPTQTAAYPTAVTNFGTPRDPSVPVTNTANTANTANTGLQNDQTYNELDYRNMGS
jgi:hypothetical protein